MEYVKCNLGDTCDFLNNLLDGVILHIIIASVDIEAPCFNKPHNLGLEVVKYWLEKYPEIKKHGTYHIYQIGSNHDYSQKQHISL